jgi:hypothetical protein
MPVLSNAEGNPTRPSGSVAKKSRVPVLSSVTRPLTARRPARVLSAASRSAPKTTKHFPRSPI